MSRVRQEISSVQFQVQTGNANASMEALQTAAKGLNDQITKVKENIKSLGNVAANDANLLKFQKDLKDLEVQYRDINKAMSELTRGVKAADKLWKAAKIGKIEGLSVKEIMAGQRGLQQRMQNLQPGNAEDAKTARGFKAAIEEADKVLLKFRSDFDALTAKISNGGKVSQGALEKAREDLKAMLSMTSSGTEEWQKYNQQLTLVEGTLNKMVVSQKRIEGESLLDKSKNGKFAQSSVSEIEQVIAKLKEYQSLINAPTSLGKKKFNETTEEIKKLEAQLVDLRNQSAQTDAILNKPKGRSFNELKAAIEAARQRLNNMHTDTEKGKKNFDELAAKVKKAEIEMKNLGAASKGTASAFDKAWSRLKTYIGLYMGAAVAIQKIVGTLGDLAELSDRMGEVRKTTGFTAEEVGNLSRSLAKLDTRTPIQNLMELSAVAGQLGLKTEQDVKGFTEAANMLMVALPEMGKEGATAMLKVALATGEIDKIRKQLEEGTIEGSDAVSVAMTKIGSTIDSLRANSAAAAPAITDFVKRVGAVGAQSGISIDQVAALGSTVDALGMRVEMSATALSRMLPAIKNNAFDLAKAIGVTPETIRELYDAGNGMDAVLMILQHIKDSGMDGETIESMLGKGGMADVMKDLNQQGARAGIVFAGLSQNVDELRRQLGVAKTAYEENIAIQNEYDKMNETTAAKWERLKNKFEEMFVGDTGQRALGGFIDGLREIVDLISGPLNTAVTTLALSFAAFRIGLGEAAVALWGYLVNTGDTVKKLTMWLKGLSTANLWGAALTAIVTISVALYNMRNSISEAQKALGETNAKINIAIDRLGGYFNALNETAAALDRAKESTKGLKEGSEELAKAESEVVKASNAHKNAIAAINGTYGQYLGFMLTEYDRATLVAAAHDKIAAAIRREMLAKQEQSAVQKVYDNYTEDMTEDLAKLSKGLTEKGLNNKETATAKRDLQKFIRENISYNTGTGKWNYTKSAGDKLRSAGYNIDGREANEIIAMWFDKYLEDNYHLSMYQRQSITGVNQFGNIYGGANLRSDFAKTMTKQIKDLAETQDVFAGEIGSATQEEMDASLKIVKELQQKAKNAQEKIVGGVAGKQRDKAYEDLAAALEGLDKNITKIDQVKDAAIVKQVNELADTINKTVDSNTLLAARARQQSLLSRATGGTASTYTPNANTGGKSPWGTPPSAESSAYADMDADALVARRKQMNKFVRALQTDTDVESVLGEDAQLRKAIENGLSKDMRSVVEWYNTERTKIQEELKSRHLTNTGDWLDAKTGRKTKKATEDTWALAELERYYQWRKEIIEDARIEEGLTEADFNRRMDELEKEHLQKRSELRQRFTTEDKQFAQEFEQWWESIEELDEVNWKKIDNEWDAATKKQRVYNNRKMQKDLADIKAITVKELNAIADIIAKERPYDGITRNLSDNLTKMGILDVANSGVQNTSKGRVYDNAKYAEENLRRVIFLLGEAEHAYSITIDDLLKKMTENGFGAWAEELGKNDAMQRGLMAQLHLVFDSITKAIKKEARLVKDEMEIIWNDVTGDGGKSLKQTFESMISQTGQLEDSVKRANSLIGAGYASENVANKLAIKQMEIRLQMQETYYNMLKKQWADHIASLIALGKLEDAEHAKKSMNLSLSEEQKKLDEQRVAIAAKLEESQNNLYKNLREWGTLLSDSLRSLFEASNAGNSKFYNERAKLQLTGGTGGTQQIVVIDNAGTSDAVAHYETLDEMQMLEREREIEQQNAVADAWKKAMDDINQKMNDMITDQINAMLQNASTDANTDATLQNTQAIIGLTATMGGNVEGSGVGADLGGAFNSGFSDAFGGGAGETGTQGMPLPVDNGEDAAYNHYVDYMTASDTMKDHILENQKEIQDGEQKADKKMAASAQSMYAKMTQAANLYGVAYQAMSNDNLSATQKLGMIGVQAAGQAAIATLTADFSKDTADTTSSMPAILAECLKINPIAGAAIFAALTAILGGLMGFAASRVAKSKSEIASVTGANNSVASGRLTTGMLTYAEGNVNEFTDPASLTPGRQYNVDGADGRKYRARYTGSNPSTHITNGPEFHLVGERGREMIIDAGTTRQITMNEKGIWAAIQTLSSGGRLRRSSMRRGKGILGFADGNVGDFSEDMELGGAAIGVDMSGIADAIERQNAIQEALLKRLSQPIEARFDVYGKGGLIDSYDSGKKAVTRYGQPY